MELNDRDSVRCVFTTMTRSGGVLRVHGGKNGVDLQQWFCQGDDVPGRRMARVYIAYSVRGDDTVVSSQRFWTYRRWCEKCARKEDSSDGNGGGGGGSC